MDLTNRRKVLRGPSTYAFRPILISMMALLGAGIVGLLASFAAGGAHPSTSTWSGITTLIAVVIGIGLLTGLAVFAASIRSRAELAEGYTTTPFGYQEVDLVDPRTGIILRSAGEPLIDKRTFLDRRQRARLTTARPDPDAQAGGKRL